MKLNSVKQNWEQEHSVGINGGNEKLNCKVIKWDKCVHVQDFLILAVIVLV